MKQYRRVEITAFRRRVFVTSRGVSRDISESEVSIVGDGSDETIKTGSEEGQRIIEETVRLLEEKLIESSRTIERSEETDGPI